MSISISPSSDERLMQNKDMKTHPPTHTQRHTLTTITSLKDLLPFCQHFFQIFIIVYFLFEQVDVNVTTINLSCLLCFR